MLPIGSSVDVVESFFAYLGSARARTLPLLNTNRSGARLLLPGDRVNENRT